MKKKLLLSTVLFITLFTSVFAFTNKSSAVELDELGLDSVQQKEILAAYDLDKNGKLQSRDVSLMLREIRVNKSGKFTEEERAMVQRCIVHDVQFKWYNAEVSRMKYFDDYISMGRLLYIDYFPNGTAKIVAHVNCNGRFTRVTYDYGKNGGRY